MLYYRDLTFFISNTFSLEPIKHNNIETHMACRNQFHDDGFKRIKIYRVNKNTKENQFTKECTHLHRISLETK